ncbi:MAG: hypothetical protein WD294_04225 [Phycisphaeraceae bacterium]
MAEANDPDARRELVLSKDTQQWVFRYAPGDEACLLRALAETARDPACEFDWFDAAVLSHQMGDHMQHQLKHMTPGWITKP